MNRLQAGGLVLFMLSLSAPDHDPSGLVGTILTGILLIFGCASLIWGSDKEDEDGRA